MTLTWVRPERRFGTLQIFGLLGLVGLLVARYIPVALLLRGFWGCPLRQHTGIPCLACGLTRAFDYTTHGRFLDALKVTPVGTLVPLVCLVVGLFAVAGALFRAPMPHVQFTETEDRRVRLTIVLAVVGNWVYMLTQSHPHWSW
jgi:hypothetical protein